MITPDVDDIDLAATLATSTGYPHETWIDALTILGRPPGRDQYITLIEGAAHCGNNPTRTARDIAAITNPATLFCAEWWAAPPPRRWWHTLLRIRNPRRIPRGWAHIGVTDDLNDGDNQS